MTLVPIQVAAPTDQQRSRALSDQLSQNVYLAQARAGESKYAMHDWYGSVGVTDRGSTDRGLYVFQDKLYQVTGQELHEITAGGSSTNKGTIPGSDRCIFDDDGVYLYIVTGGSVYQFDGSSVSAVTSSQLNNPNSTTYLNGFFIYDGQDGQFQVSDAGDGTTINALSVGVANSDSDDLVRVKAFQQTLYLMGEKTIEPWFYSGSGNLNFDRMDRAIIDVGLAALHSVATDTQFMYFLGHDRHVYRLTGSQVDRVSTPSIARTIEQFSTVSDAIGFSLTLEGQDFYYLTFPAADRSFLYSATLNYWVNLSTGMFDGQYFASSYAYCYGNHYVADYRDGSIKRLDPDAFDDDGETRLRRRIMGPLTSQQLGMAGNERLVVSTLFINMEVGQGLVTGQGVDPVLMCRVSGNGGYTYSPQKQVNIGVLGNYDFKPRFDQFQDGYTIVYQIECSDPVYLSIYGGSVDVESAGY